ncbi:cyclic nucleotide-binding domain-containing protein [Mycobacterium spongiae]|uniref:Cyclic nucleotide-binding domain-containing protein n=1 Tax=Mycobacterium spongiae TaxID=886343 RepID=A0A975JZS3_9MYCO|nr:cyclic nucleotide-binding domain-containing protein [Mycobacterium spongiae]QUR68731.1 cyclic nucleotide-binding domain-containing protein [Mycobacterium spongiae]
MSTTDEQLDAFLAALPEVRKAETEEEREAIFAFRYQVYGEELGRKLGTEKGVKRTHDDEDDKPYSTLLYTADEKGITGTSRMRVWEPGEVPAKDFAKFSMERLPGIERLRTGEGERLMVRPDQRSGLVIAALSLAVLDLGRPDWYIDLLFGYCTPGLVPYYLNMGWRRYAGRMIPTPDGIHAPLVLVISDVEHFRSVGSFLAAPIERENFEPLDTAPFTELFEERNLPVQFDKELVRAAIDRGVAADVGFLAGISTEAIETLAEKGFVIQLPSGELLTEAGLGERELFVIIDGEFESFSEECVLRRMGPGEVVGEVAFFSSDGRRTASVRSVRDGRVLVLRRRVVDELRDSAPAVAAEILFHLARTLADRTGRAHVASSTAQEMHNPNPVGEF